MGALRSVLAQFDIEVHSEQLDAGSSKIDKVIGQLGALGVAMLAWRAVKGFVHWGEEVAKAAREVEFHAGRMEMDTDAYQKLSQVAENYGMSLENLQIANTLFTRALGNAGGVMGVLGGHSRHATAAFKSLGLSAAQFKGQKLEDILPVISDAMLKIEDPMERVTAGLNLFGHRGRSIMPMMAQGGDAIRRAFAAAVPVFEKATIEAANKATISGKQLSRVWDNLVNNSLGKAAMLMFSKLADKLADFVLHLKDLSKNSQIGQAALIAFGVAGVAVATWLLVAFAPVLIPVLALLAAFAALALVVDDFIVFMHGGHSVIGAFFNELLGPGGAETARKKIKELWEEFKGFLKDVTKGFGSEFGKDMREGLHDMVQALREIKALMAWISEKWETSKEMFDSFGHKLGGGSTGPKDKLASDLPSVAAQIATIDAPASLTGGLGPSESSGSPAPTPGVVPGSGVTFVVNALDPHEVIRKVKPVVEEINSQSWRDALAGTGGAR